MIFCGLNWNADIYNFPPETITGMIEVNPILETLNLLRLYAKGDRIGYIGAKTYSEEKELNHLKNTLNISLADGALVSDFRHWKETYLRLQKTADMLIFLTPTPLPGWKEARAQAFIEANTKIPTGSTGDNTARYTLLGKVKIAEEQGWWAGNTALSILRGTPVKNIPVTTNKNSRLFLNMRLAKNMGILFPLELLEKATLLHD